MAYYGHTMRTHNIPEKYKWLQDAQHSRLEKSGTAASRRRWTADISEWTGLNINDVARVLTVAEDREQLVRI